MRIVQINTFPYKATGAIMLGIHQLLLQNRNESFVVWGRGRGAENDNEIVIKDELGVKIHGVYTRLTDRTGFASQSATRRLISQLEIIKPDIIHLHNIHGYYLNIEMLFEFIKAHDIKVVWTLHDCWAMTGHCAYFDMVECQKWKTGCSHCEQKNTYPTSILLDSSKWNWNKKKELFAGINAVIVTPSKWLENIVKQSYLSNYPVQVIHNGIDTELYRPRSNGKLKSKYAPRGEPIVLGVASEWTERKGLNDFIHLAQENQDIRFIVVGVKPEQKKKLPAELIGICRTSNVNELVELYSVADVFFNPTYEDNYPTTNLEALACGTPVITYDTGGSPEVIEDALKKDGTAIGTIIKKETSQRVDLGRVIKEIRKMVRLVNAPIVNGEFTANSADVKESSSIMALDRGELSLREKCRSVALEYGKEQRLAEYIKLYKELLSC
ncbi:glycosyltransferase [Blautia massiliensis (ex Liu et al. 2021)]|uniref:glycosyltransferase n=1 Tax=Blautia massiliensis (ex Liu et al. 2021) TaxID=3062492 RepID=UPI003F8BAB63